MYIYIYIYIYIVAIKSTAGLIRPKVLEGGPKDLMAIYIYIYICFYTYIVYIHIYNISV